VCRLFFDNTDLTKEDLSPPSGERGGGDTWRAANDAELFTFVNVEVLLFAMPLDMSKSIALFEGFPSFVLSSF
jgi:hypothetical protein